MICSQTASICRASSRVKKANLFSPECNWAAACSWAREKSGKAPNATTAPAPASNRDKKALRESSSIPELRHSVAEHSILSTRTRLNAGEQLPIGVFDRVRVGEFVALLKRAVVSG